MPWNRKLKPPLTLTDGRRLETLADARLLFLGLPELHRSTAHWRHAGELMLGAANGRKSALAKVDDQLFVNGRDNSVTLTRTGPNSAEGLS